MKISMSHTLTCMSVNSGRASPSRFHIDSELLPSVPSTASSQLSHSAYIGHIAQPDLQPARHSTASNLNSELLLPALPQSHRINMLGASSSIISSGASVPAPPSMLQQPTQHSNSLETSMLNVSSAPALPIPSMAPTPRSRIHHTSGNSSHAPHYAHVPSTAAQQSASAALAATSRQALLGEDELGGLDLDKHAHMVYAIQILVQQNRVLFERMKLLEAALAEKAESAHVHHLNEIVGVEERFAEASQELTVFPPMVAALQQSTQQALLTLQAEIKTKAEIKHRHTITELDGVREEIATRAPLSHIHHMSQVDGLAAELKTKAELRHTHSCADVDGVKELVSTKADKDSWMPVILPLLDAKMDKSAFRVRASDVEGLAQLVDAKCDPRHTHDMRDILGLGDAISVFAPLHHDHTLDQVAGIRELVATKADIVHTHAPCTMQSISGLSNELSVKADQRSIQTLGNALQAVQTELQRKADLQHGHPIAQVSGLQDELAKKAPLHHGHYIQHVHELQQELSRRADVNHRHQMPEVLGLAQELQRKADSNHLHGINAIVGLQEVLDRKLEQSAASSSTSSRPLNVSSGPRPSISSLSSIGGTMSPIQPAGAEAIGNLSTMSSVPLSATIGTGFVDRGW